MTSTDRGAAKPDDSKLPGRRTVLLLLGGTLAAYVAVLVFVGVGEALDEIGRATVAPLVGALALEMATIASLAMVHRSSAAAVGHHVRYREALNVSMTAFTLTQAVPGGGAVAGAEVVRRWTKFGLAGPYATVALALTATLATSTIALIGAGGVAVSVVRGDLRGRVLVGSLVVLVVLLGILALVLAVVRSPDLGARVIRRLGKLHRALGDRAEEWVDSLEHPEQHPPSLGALMRIVAWSAVNWGADIAALGLVFIAFGQNVTIATVLVGFAASQLGAAIPFTPGGTGFVEGGMVATFVAVGLSLSMATAVVVTYRVFATWLPMLAGLPALLRPPRVRD